MGFTFSKRMSTLSLSFSKCVDERDNAQSRKVNKIPMSSCSGTIVPLVIFNGRVVHI